MEIDSADKYFQFISISNSTKMRTLLMLCIISYEITRVNLQNEWIEMSGNLRKPANS